MSEGAGPGGDGSGGGCRGAPCRVPSAWPARAAAGFSSAVPRAALEAIAADGAAAVALADWATFRQGALEGRVPPPFLWAGTVLDAPAAAVYALSEAGRGVVGLALSSEAADQS